MRPKYPAIHGGADYVLPILLTQGNAPITGELVATYRVGTELVSREFSDVVDIGVVADPINAAYEVHRYDCVISAYDTAAIGADAMVRIDINLTVGERKMQALGVVVPYYAYGGSVDSEPHGEHVVVTAQRLVTTVVNVIGSGVGSALTTGDQSIIIDENSLRVNLLSPQDAEWPLQLVSSVDGANGIKGDSNFFSAAVVARVLNAPQVAGVDATNQDLTNLTGAVPYLDGTDVVSYNTPIRILTGQTNPAEIGAYRAVLGGAIRIYGVFFYVEAGQLWACGEGYAQKIYDLDAPPAGGMAIESPIAGSTAKRLLFSGDGNVLAESEHFTFDPATKNLTHGGTTVDNYWATNGMLQTHGALRVGPATEQRGLFNGGGYFSRSLEIGGLIYFGDGAIQPYLNIFFALIGSTTNNVMLFCNATGDVSARYRLKAGGLHEWGNGVDDIDVTFSRSAAGRLACSGVLGAAGLKLDTFTVGTLPIAPSLNDRYTVTNALGPALYAVVSAGGSALTDVKWDGSNWIVCG